MKVFAFDFETFLISPGQRVPRAVSLAWSYGGEPDLVHCILERDRFRAVAEEGLAADVLTGANVAFDLAVLVRAFPDLLPAAWKAYDEGRVWDIEHTEKLCDLHDGRLHWQWDPTRPNKKTGGVGMMVRVSYSLAAIMQRRFGIVLDKDTWRLRYGTLAGTPCAEWPEGARKYALDDATSHYRVWAAQAEESITKLIDLERQARAAWWLFLLEARGFQIDREHVEELSRRIVVEREKTAAALEAAGLVKGGKRDTKMAAARMTVVCAAKGLEIPRTPKGKVKVTKETAFDTGDPVLESYARFTALTNMLSGSIVTLRAAAQAGMPIQSRFEVLQETGRTSCSTGAPKKKKGANPYEMGYGLQLQNVRRNILDEDGEEIPGVRECFVPRPGYVLCSIDYGQLELCTWAQACIDLDCGHALADALNAGHDVHSMLGARIFGLTYEWVKANRKKDKKAANARQAGKPLNFGLPGGMGPKGIVKYAKTGYNVIFTLDEAKSHIEVWKGLWPENEKYFAFVRNCVGQGQMGFMVQLRSKRRRGGCGFTDGANCVDYETEALTERGWVKGPDIRPTDRLLTKNADTGALEWQTPKAVHLYPDRVGPLVEFSTTRFSAVTTPNHRWLVFDKKTRKNICVTSEEISRHGDHRIHRTGIYEAPDAPYSDDFIELVGWVLTDGSLSDKGTRVSVFQTKKHNVERIDALFKRMGLAVRRRVVSERGAVRWAFSSQPMHRTGLAITQGRADGTLKASGVSHTREDYERAEIGKASDSVVALRLGVSLSAVGRMRRKLGLPRPAPDGHGIAAKIRELFPERLLTPAFVAALSARQARLLFDTMMRGDGTRTSAGQQVFFTRSEAAAAAFQMLCVLAGKASKALWRDMSGVRPKKYASMKNVPRATGIWEVRPYRRDKVQVLKHQVREFVDARGVWCPEVPNTYFVARRAGAVYVTGNTLFQGLAADLAKDAGYRVSRACYAEPGPPLYGSYVVNFIHDELLLELPEERASDAAIEAARIMRDVGAQWCPDVKPDAQPALMRRWHKEAETKKDATGRLIPWEPA
jgi:DNA polymerase-1